MSFLSDIGDAIQGGLSDLSGYGNILKPILSLGLGYASNAAKGDSQDALVSLLQNQEAQKYQGDMAYYNAYKDWMAQSAAAANANAAARARASAAAAAAANENEKRRVAALQRATARLDRGYRSAQSQLKPWADSAKRLLPAQESVYGNALSNMNLLQGYLMRPENMALLSPATPATSVSLPLPSWMSGGK